MKLIIVRHAETEGNANHIIQGQNNSPLTGKGKIQAENLAKRLNKENINVVYSSDLGRCKDTLKPFLKGKEISVHYTRELREICRGIFDGRPDFEYQEWLKKNSYIDMEVKHPKGESFPDLIKRVSEFIEQVIKKNKGQTVLIMAHGGSKRALLMYLLKKYDSDSIMRFRKLSANTALSIIKMKDDGNHEIELLYNVDHLEDIR